VVVIIVGVVKDGSVVVGTVLGVVGFVFDMNVGDVRREEKDKKAVFTVVEIADIRR
jgi:hypothetical protein